MATSWTTLSASVLLIIFAIRVAGDVISRWAQAYMTVLDELQELGKDRRDEKKLKGTAVICGGSIAGLLAARVCSGHFEDVLILDPDNDVLTSRCEKSLPSKPFNGEVDNTIGLHPRSRVMQNRIIHLSQALNLLALERLWKDIRPWLSTAGAAIGRMDASIIMDGVPVPSPVEFFPGGLLPEVFSMTRGAYETLLRFLVTRIPNVRFVKGTVTGIQVYANDTQKIESVSYRGGEDSQTNITQKVQLLIDCTGPTHAGYTWLKRAGFTLPTKESYDPHMRYYTTEFTVDPEIMEKILPFGFKTKPILLSMGAPIDKEQNVFAITQVEHNRIHVMTGGWGYKGTITNVADIHDYVKALRLTQPAPNWLFDLFEYLEGEPEKTANAAVASAGPLFYIKYHEGSHLPSNFLALGDSVMKVNPVFGQGLTKAMIGCIVLNHWLMRQTTDISTSFAHDVFGMLHNKLSTTWDGTKYVDYLLDTTDPSASETLRSGAALRWFLKRIDELEIAGHREIVWRKFLVMQWLAPPTALMTPKVLAAVMMQDIRRRWIAKQVKAS